MAASPPTGRLILVRSGARTPTPPAKSVPLNSVHLTRDTRNYLAINHIPSHWAKFLASVRRILGSRMRTSQTNRSSSRANGAKSKGPVTPLGKRNSSRNATPSWSARVRFIVLETEHADRFLKLLSDLFEEHQPSTPTQMMLVETIAAARWRQSRIWGMQKVAFDHDVASIDTDPGSPALRAVLALHGSVERIRIHELLLRYETALDRQISRSLLRLHQLQDRSMKGEETRESMAPHSGLRDDEQIAHGAAPASKPTVDPIESHSTLRAIGMNQLPPRKEPSNPLGY